MGEETKALCGMHPVPPPPPARTVFPAQKLHCEAGPSNQWGWHRVGGGPKEWLWVQSGKGAGQGSPAGMRTSLVSSGLPPMSVLQRGGGAGGQLRSPIDHGQGLVIRCCLCTWAVPGSALSPGRVLSPWPATHTLTSSSSSASANSKVFACTVLGTGALLPAWGAPHSSSRLSQEARAWGSTPPSSWLQASLPV